MFRRLLCLLGGSFLVILSAFPALGAEGSAKKFTLTSPAFQHGEPIPAQHTCKGKNLSPALKWANAPKGTQSFVLIMEDPDAPIGTWTHWVLYNIPPTISNLPGEFPASDRLANGEFHGRNDFQTLGYGGPCPPSGNHRYYFRLYALDTAPLLEPGLPKSAVKKAMKGHVLAKAVLMGRVSWRQKAVPAPQKTEDGLENF